MSKFKKGDRVRTKGYEGTHWDGEGVIVRVGEYCNIVKINDEEGGFHDHELAPATLQIQPGKFYRTRDGRKVGPMRRWHDLCDHPWGTDDDDLLYIWADDGTEIDGDIDDGADLVAEASGAESVKEIFDNLEAWQREQRAGSTAGSMAGSTAGFTVPLCAYEDAVTTTALGDAYVAGYKAGLAAQQATAQQALAA